ncbi:MAG TPA: lysoplasmalogenase [Cyclobacteriaceae bacterium]|jgi:uncharacterized membrane protein YhhN|nr:lysoplasmalogenase [Cyclobacteriaceae bacterium]
MPRRLFQILFFFFAMLEIVSQIFDLSNLHFVSKPLLVILLAAFYRQSVPSINGRFILALIFCWLGDVFLLLDQMNEIFFMAGLGSFLLAHVILIFTYRILMTPEDNFKGTQRIRLSFPVILVGTGLVVVLYPRLGDLKFPVIVYAFALTLMVLQAIFRLGRTNAKSFWLVFFGAAFFMLSDSLLAINKFYQPISSAGVWIMMTYIAAIYFIVNGVIAHEEQAR